MCYVYKMYICVNTVLLFFLIAVAVGNDNITVIRTRLTFEEKHVLDVNASVEYILEFVPTGDEGLWPSRVWMQIDSGDTAHPVLITARRRIGATTWQLPYYSSNTQLFQQERTLCPEDSINVESLREDCESPDPIVRGTLTMHVSATCVANTSFSLRVTPDRNWFLPFDVPVSVYTAQGAPRVHRYQFQPEQDNVRLVVESEDDICATIAIQNYTCPIADTMEQIEASTIRMTMLKSGAAQISKSNFPRGFYVIYLVHDSDDVCHESIPGEEDWLWEAAVLAAAENYNSDRPQIREKSLTLHIKAALTRSQYFLGAGVTLAIFLLFYVMFGAYILAQRFPAWKRLVAPKAVLAPKLEEVTRSEVESTLSTTPARRRRDSAATFDSSDNSDSGEDEPEPVVTSTTVTTVTATPVITTTTMNNTSVGTEPVNGIYVVDQGLQQDIPSTTVPVRSNTTRTSVEADGALPSRPFGLPARLHVAALARRHDRVLRARSKRYLYTLYTVGLFYALPVVQFVAAFQVMLNLSGSLDICYYNFLCAHPAGAISDFNHVFSNVGYLLLGALCMLQVRRRKMRRKRSPRNEEYGIPSHYGLLSSLGATMMMVALLSATYHICPNGLNFQFDTAFMYVLAVLSMVKIYQSRHPDINARAHATFGVLAVLILLVVWGVLGGGPLFWSIFTVLHVFTFLLLSLRIYYVGQFRLEKESLQVAARGLRSLPQSGIRPLYTARLVMLVIANAVNWAFALYGLFTQSADFASHLLIVLLSNTLMHMIFYLTMKLLHGERPRWYVWVYLAAGAAAWAPSLYFFTYGSSNWATTPALSRHSNHECRVLQFYDSHDLWHMLSAVALYFSFNVMLTWDDGLAAVKRTEIAVF